MVSEKNIIFLTGFMGSGKTKMASQLSEVSGLPFIDMDEAIENDSGMSIAEYFVQYGETAFRTAEHKLLSELIRYRYMIIATGGGTPCHHNNMEIMNRHGSTVYLRRKAEQLFSGLQLYTTERPLLKGMSEEELMLFIRSELIVRENFYMQAKYVVEESDIRAEHIFRLLKDAGCWFPPL